MHIVLEGLDAAGKATQSRLLAERLTRCGREAVVFSFPRYDTPTGAAIKRHLMREIVVAQVARVPSGALCLYAEYAEMH